MNSAKNILVIMGCLVLVLAITSCGSLNPKTEGQIYSALEAKQDAFKQCYEKALETDRNVKGDVQLSLKFQPKSKRPNDTKVSKSDIKDDKMLQCVSSTAEGIRIEDEPGVSVEGQYTVNFDAQD